MRLNIQLPQDTASTPVENKQYLKPSQVQGIIKKFRLGGDKTKDSSKDPLQGLEEANQFQKEYTASDNFYNLSKKGGDDDVMIQKRRDNINSFDPQKDVRVSKNWSNPMSYVKEDGKLVLSNQLGGWPSFEDVNAHELGHYGYSTGDKPINPNMQKKIGSKNLAQQHMDKLKRYRHSVNEKHDASPQETRADLFQLRYKLNKNNIYDSRKSGEFTPDHLEQWKKTGEWNRLQRLYKDEDIIWLMNNLAQNKQPQQPIQTAKLGGDIQQFQNGEWISKYDDGGKKKFLEPNDKKLPQGRIQPFYYEPSSELASSIGGEQGTPAYLIPTFKYGHPLDNPLQEYKDTGEHLGGPFKTWQEADEWENTIRHPYVEKGQSLPSPLKRWGKDYENGGFLGTTNRGRDYTPEWGGQFQNGGIKQLLETEIKSISPRQQAYNDSLALYNDTKRIDKWFYETHTNVHPGRKVSVENAKENHLLQQGSLLGLSSLENKIQPIAFIEHNIDGDTGKGKDHSPVYKKPVYNPSEHQVSRVEPRKPQVENTQSAPSKLKAPWTGWEQQSPDYPNLKIRYDNNGKPTHIVNASGETVEYDSSNPYGKVSKAFQYPQKKKNGGVVDPEEPIGIVRKYKPVEVISTNDNTSYRKLINPIINENPDDYMTEGTPISTIHLMKKQQATPKYGKFDNVNQLLANKPSDTFMIDSLYRAGATKWDNKRKEIEKKANLLEEQDFVKYYMETQVFPTKTKKMYEEKGYTFKQNPEYEKRIHGGEKPILLQDKENNIRHNTPVSKKVIDLALNASDKTGLNITDGLTLFLRENGFEGSSTSTMAQNWSGESPNNISIFNFWQSSPKWKKKIQKRNTITDKNGTILNLETLSSKELIEYYTDYNKYQDATSVKNEIPFENEFNFLKKVGIQGYNSREKDRKFKWDRDKKIILNNKELMDYISTKKKSVKKPK